MRGVQGDVSTKMILTEARRVAEEQGIQNFVGTESWCYQFLKRQCLSMRTKTKLEQMDGRCRCGCYLVTSTEKMKRPTIAHVKKSWDDANTEIIVVI